MVSELGQVGHLAELAPAMLATGHSMALLEGDIFPVQGARQGKARIGPLVPYLQNLSRRSARGSYIRSADVGSRSHRRSPAGLA